MNRLTILILLILTVCAAPEIAAQTRRPAASRNRKPARARQQPLAPKKAAAAPNAAAKAVTTASGLTYLITEPGAGELLKAGATVTVNYTGLLTNGIKFDSSLDRGQPIAFVLGAGRVIKGWDEAIQKLRVGSRATLIIPPELGYGARGAGMIIPPNATLVFIIEVMSSN